MVRLNEFNHIEKEPGLDYNLVDDIYFYAVNDDDFYRKNYYPAMNKCKQSGNNEMLMPMIDSCIKEYCTKYKIPKQIADQITSEDKNVLMQRMLDSEKQDEGK
jgi:hypothetical protein